MLASRGVSGWKLLVVGFAVALFLEGLPYFLSPSAARKALGQLLALPDGILRAIGLVLMLAGLALAWLAAR